LDAVRLINIELRIGSFKLGPLSTSMANRTYNVIMGPTGSGKSTLLKVIAGAYRPNSGSVIVDGVDVTNKPPELRGIAYVPQGYALFDHMTVYGNIEYGLKVRGMPKSIRAREVYRIAEDLGIVNLLNRKVNGLSGGESQKVALARALIVRPRVLLLDEPMSMMDVSTRESLIPILREIPRKYDTVVIHVTHDRDEAYALADKVTIINNGRLIEEGEPEEVFTRPKRLFTAQFVGFTNIIPAKAVKTQGGSMVHVGDLTLHSSEGIEGNVYVCIRPEWFNVTNEGGLNVIEGTVLDVERGRMGYRVRVSAGGVTFNVVVQSKLSSGDVVKLSIPPDMVHLIPAY